MTAAATLPCPPRVVAPPPRRAAATRSAAPGAADTPWRGCGWFESSDDLHRGLAVQEIDVVDLLRQPGGLRFLVASA